MSHVLLIGKPNSGKSLLFNRLTGLQQKVANFPGITVEVKSGQDHLGTTIVDFPGVYSLTPLTQDEAVAIEKFKQALAEDSPHTIVCVLDGTRLERSLLLGTQIQVIAAKLGKPLIFALNMMDMLEPHSSIDASALSKALGSPVIPVSARTRKGINILEQQIEQAKTSPEDFVAKLSDAQLTTHPQIRARQLNKEFGPQTEVILKSQNRLDKFFLSNWLGGIAFALVMLILFQSIFTWSTPMMEAIEAGLSLLAEWVVQVLPNGVFRDFITEAMIAGVGSFLVFVPQIFVLTFIVGLLEDSGYMARASIVCHRPLSIFGLSGKSFVPLLSGFACAIPAVYAARTVESPKRRLLTMMAIPLMACSARLPVYSLLIAALIPSVTFAGGMIGYQGLTFFALYAFGLILALLISGLLSSTLYKTESDSPFILELPPYRLPHWRPLLLRSFNSAKSFVVKAGAIIFIVTVVIWVLGYFPHGPGQLQHSWLASLGRVIEPIFAPMGLDWKFGVAIIASFLAREVFVGTLGTFYGIEGADENIAGLAENLQNSGFSISSAISLLVFYAVALQCVSTLAVLKQETGSWKMPMLALFGYSGLAYVLSLSVQLFF